MKVEFRPIHGFTKYGVSRKGDVIRFEYNGVQYQPSCDCLVKYTLPEKILRPCIKQRYGRVSLINDEGVRKTLLVHRLVALMWVKQSTNPDAKFVNHIDCNTLNNNADNLEWVTHSQNMQHSIVLGRKPITEKQRECGRRMIKLNGRFAKNGS